MKNDEIRLVKPGTKVFDNMTGEESEFISFPDDSKWVLVNNHGTTIFLDPERIELV